VTVLCPDELTYVIPPKNQANTIFQILSKRIEPGKTLVTNNLVPADWKKTFNTATAPATLDPLRLNGRFIPLEGRARRSKK
jgi:DNA replication protein DnaC